MIEDPPLLTINTRFDRPDPSVLGTLGKANSGVLVDCLDGSGAIPIKPVNPKANRFIGVAVTCDCGPADNLAAFGALKITQPGDVIVISTGGYQRTAVIGDMVLGMAKNCGAVAMVTDGYVRDLDGICEVGLPCFAAGITPNSPARNGPGTVGLPIVLDGVSINSGDIIFGDRDGVVVVPNKHISTVLARLPQVQKAEAEMEANVKGGLKLPAFVDGILNSDQVKIIE
ncbi:MAG: RraA family protein [Pseudomonadota bacterium]